MEYITSLSSLFHMANLELVVRVILEVFLLLSAAFFAGSETALFSLSRLDLQKLRTSRNPRSDQIHELLDEPRRLIISILCGNELIGIASSANMVSILVILLGESYSVWVNVLIMVPMMLLLGDLTPKTFAITFPTRFATTISAPLLPKWITFITPLRESVRFLSDRITTFVVGEAVTKENILQADEFRTLVEESAEKGVICATERVLIDNMLEASETRIMNIMTPRTRVNFLDADEPFPELIAKFRRYKHPRVPVIRGDNDNVLGFLHSEDVLRIMRLGKEVSNIQVETILKPAHFVPLTKTVDDMFHYFQRHNTRAAIIIGEFGGVAGIVTMKDVLTFLFGEISGPVVGEELILKKNEDCYEVPGDMRLADFNNLTHYFLSDPFMTTVGGVAFRIFDKLPKQGDSVIDNGIRFTVVTMDGRRIETLCIQPAGLILGPENELKDNAPKATLLDRAHPKENKPKRERAGS